MPALKDSQTKQNLKDAFAGESQANRRYLYFAQKADIEGYNDVATVFRSTAEDDIDRTTADGKASAIQFLHFPFTDEQVSGFKDLSNKVVIGINHEKYGHIAIMP
jgi:rubrerythrin